MSVCATCRGYGFARGGSCWNCNGSGSEPDAEGCDDPPQPTVLPMTPPEPRGGEGCDRLASVVAMLERIQGPTASVRIYAHEAKVILDALRPSSPGGGGWPSREAIESGHIRNAVVNIVERYISGWAGEHGDNPYDAAPLILSEILALFPPVAGWRPIDEHDNSRNPVVIEDKHGRPVVAWRNHPSSRTDNYLSIPGDWVMPYPKRFIPLPPKALRDHPMKGPEDDDR